MNNCFDCSKPAMAGQKLASMAKHAAICGEHVACRLSQLVLITAKLFNQPKGYPEPPNKIGSLRLVNRLSWTTCFDCSKPDMAVGKLASMAKHITKREQHMASWLSYSGQIYFVEDCWQQKLKKVKHEMLINTRLTIHKMPMHTFSLHSLSCSLQIC